MIKTIRVTQEHISAGVPGDPCKCPVTLASKEQLHNDVTTNIDFQREVAVLCFYEVLGNESSFRVDLPKSIYHKIRHFDREKVMEPCEFTIELPDELDWLSPQGE